MMVCFGSAISKTTGKLRALLASARVTILLRCEEEHLSGNDEPMLVVDAVFSDATV